MPEGSLEGHSFRIWPNYVKSRFLKIVDSEIEKSYFADMWSPDGFEIRIWLDLKSKVVLMRPSGVE